MLEKVESYRTSDGRLFHNRREALKHEFIFQLEELAESAAISCTDTQDAIDLMAHKPDIFIQLLKWLKDT